ncbi:BatD family protein [Flavobacteriaceae bacterium]|nr:BatD family protein [Flavobacteriaceae bacterium]
MIRLLVSRSLVGFLLLITFMTQAQVSFEAKVSKKRLGLNERLRVDFEMNENGDNFIPPLFTGFQVVSGPQQAVSRSWVNGVRSFSKTYTYFLTPKLKGKITLDQAQITINGEVYKTTPITIEVTEAVEKPNDPNNIDYITDENIKLVAEISNSNPYLNEGISVVYKLYFRNPISISDVQELESPSYGDFWSHLIKIGQVRVNTKGVYNGEPYNEVVWRKVVLYPQKTGKLNIEPLTLNLSLSVPSNRRDLFGRRILTQGQKTITAGRRVIDVKSLPEKNKPPGFTGAVGQFDFDVILDKDALKASESFQATLKVKGNGNLKLFNLPKINVPNTLEVYEPEHTENVKINLSGMDGTIEDAYTIVPQYQGKYPIPPVQFSYFDPKTKNYKSVRSQDLLVDVFEGPVAGNSRDESKSLTKHLVDTADTTFSFIILNTKLSPINTTAFWKSTLFWSLLGLPIMLMFLAFLLKRFILERKEDSVSSKQREAQRLAKKYLSSAKKAFEDQVVFYEALERALHNYLKAKLQIETTELTKDKIERLLLNKKVNKQTALDFVAVIENCELARYAPGSSVSIKVDYEKASSVIASIDRQL